MKTLPEDSINGSQNCTDSFKDNKMVCSPANSGLTKREYFAALALQGFCAHHGINYGTHFLANHAVDAADLLILELNRGQE